MLGTAKLAEPSEKSLISLCWTESGEPARSGDLDDEVQPDSTDTISKMKVLEKVDKKRRGGDNLSYA